MCNKVRSWLFMCHHKATGLTGWFDTENDRAAMYPQSIQEEESEVAMSLACLESVFFKEN